MSIDLLWSDPDHWSKGWQKNTRGASYTFGQDIVKEMCGKLDIDLVARAHQVVQDGYEFFAGSGSMWKLDRRLDRRLVTIFTAPHYCGQFDNAAASMKVRSRRRKEMGEDAGGRPDELLLQHLPRRLEGRPSRRCPAVKSPLSPPLSQPINSRAPLSLSSNTEDEKAM